MTDRTVVLTLEPHLFLFQSYKTIDNLELRHRYVYENADEAFDAAANALILSLVSFS